MKIITLTSDFGVQSQGVAIMEAIIYNIAPEAKIIHFMHGLPSFNMCAAARTLETIKYISPGYHVCVCDPGVGSKRKPIIIKVKRGDYLIGPDNGVLLPAARVLGGIESVYQIDNEKYINQPVSSIFHGRDIFAPTAAYLFAGIELNKIGRELLSKNLNPPPYYEAIIRNNTISAQVIQINKFGSLHLNILHHAWDNLGLKAKDVINAELPNKIILELPVSKTFCDVPIGKPLILKDDYGRVEIALNLEAFSEVYKIVIGDKISLHYKSSINIK